MDSIKLLIPKNLKRIGVAKRITATIIVETANRILADITGELAKQLSAVSVKDGTLTVICQHSAVAQELLFFEAEILAELNHRLEAGNIKKIRTTL